MKICRVTGTVHSTAQDSSLAGERILVTQPLDLDGAAAGAPLLALDRVDAGVGDMVLLHKEGGGARILLGNDRSPVQCIVIAVLDRVALEDDSGEMREFT